jgi:uncharacterized membrane protein (UPF0127 family)
MRSLRNGTTGEIVAPHISRARAPWTRALGYLHRRNVDAAEGLWFDRCSSIHTVGLRAAAVIELGPGVAETRVRIGDRLLLE